MIITGAFLAEVARTSDGKLDVLGGVWDFLQVDETMAAQMALVILLQQDPNEPSASTIKIEIYDPAQNLVNELSVIVSMPAGAENGFSHVTLAVQFQTLGRHNFVIDEGGNPRAISLDVRTAISS